MTRSFLEYLCEKKTIVDKVTGERYKFILGNKGINYIQVDDNDQKVTDPIIISNKDFNAILSSYYHLKDDIRLREYVKLNKLGLLKNNRKTVTRIKFNEFVRNHKKDILRINGRDYWLFRKGSSSVRYVINKYVNRFEKVNFTKILKNSTVELPKKEGDPVIYKMNVDYIDNDDLNSLKFTKYNKDQFLNWYLFQSEENEEENLKRWQIKELTITKVLLDIIEKGKNFKVEKNGKILKLNPKRYTVSNPRNGTESDIKIVNNEENKKFYIESKLNYQSGEFFKFKLTLQNKNLKYLSRKFKDDDTKNERIDKVFSGSGDKKYKSMLELISSDEKAKKSIEDFYKNINIFYNKISNWYKIDSVQSILNAIVNDGSNSKDIKNNIDEYFVYDKNTLKNVELPSHLKNIISSISIYVQFVLLVRDDINDNKTDEDQIAMYNQLVSNISKLIEGDVDDFLNTYDKTDDNSKLVFLFKTLISTVISKRGNENVMKLFDIEVNSSYIKEFVDRINDYYTYAHDARYIEIGTNPFSSSNEKYNETTWQSNVYILKINEVIDKREQSVEIDPLQLKRQFGDSVMDISDMYNMKGVIYVGISDSLDSFDFKFFINNKINDEGKTIGTLINTKKFSFEDLTGLHIKY